MRAHFFDLDTILIVDRKIWIIDRKNPSIPIVKISQSDFNLIKKGIWVDKGERFYFDGISYWVPGDISDEIKLKCKKMKFDISELSFSMREFVNSDIISDLDYEIDIDLFNNIKNTQDHIYLICSKNNKRNYELVLDKIVDKLLDIGLRLEDIYYVSETFMNRDDDSIIFNKIATMLQHSIGFKIESDSFNNFRVNQYNEIFYYDDDIENVNIDINNFLKYFIDNSEDITSKKIKSLLGDCNIYFYINYVSPNKIKRISTKRVLLSYDKIIKSFESFRY